MSDDYYLIGPEPEALIANYDSKCPWCQEQIHCGDEIVFQRDVGYVHPECAD